MEDKDLIERLEEIIETIKDGNREQAETDLADLYDEIADEYDDYDDDDDDYDDEDEDEDIDEDE